MLHTRLFFLLSLFCISFRSSSQFIQQGPKLYPSGVTDSSGAGHSVALSADGNTAAIGCYRDNQVTGAVLVFTRTNGSWAQVAKLVPNDPVAVGRFNADMGWSVAISADGNTIVAGGPADNNDMGAAWIFVNNNGVWTQQGPKLVGSDVENFSQPCQGQSVAISADGNTILSGGYNDYQNTLYTVGATWVFTRSGGTWTQQAPKLVGTDNNGDSWQGSAVALSADGNTAIIGGKADNSFTGAAWLFTRAGTTWAQQGNKLVGSGSTGQSQQGSSVALSADGNIAIVGGAFDNGGIGGAWPFIRTGTMWSQQSPRLIGLDTEGTTIYTGQSVSLSADGNVALIGGPIDDSSKGAGWIFERSGNSWKQLGSKLVGAGTIDTSRQGFGVALSADGNTAIVGGYRDSSFKGGAWVYARQTGALYFDGIDDNVTIPANPVFRTNVFTAEAWVFPMNGSQYKTVFSQQTTSDGWSLRIDDNNNWNVWNGNVHVITGPVANFNQWTHVAVVSTPAGQQLYINAVLAGQTSSLISPANSQPLVLGKESNVEASYFGGKIDEFRVWDRGLCAEEIQHNINAALNPIGEPALLALYHLDNGPDASDASGNGHTGALNNFALTGTISNFVTGYVSGTTNKYEPSAMAADAACSNSTVHLPYSHFEDERCGVIASILPSGTNPIAGITDVCVAFDATLQFYEGQPYVQRHYNITPAVNAATATATITLYFLQSDFDSYNTGRGILPPLPTGPSDIAGKSHLLITQFHGTGSAPGFYTGTTGLIDPDDNNIIWNASANRWEISFDVIGFSGFYIHTSSTNSALPLKLLQFSGTSTAHGNVLQWATASEVGTSHFEVMRSPDGISFEKIGMVPANGGASIRNAYSFTDQHMHLPLYYYRLNMVDKDGYSSYSNIINVRVATPGSASISPNPAGSTITLHLTGIGLISTKASIVNLTGQVFQEFTIAKDNQQVNVERLSSGLYFIRLADGTTIRLVKP